MGRFIRSLPPWPLGSALPQNGLFFFYDPTTDAEWSVVPSQLGSGGGELGQISSEDISDSTEAGRALLTALDAAAQLQLLDKVRVPETPTHPAFTTYYGTAGAVQFLLDRYGELAAVPRKPAAPTDPQVDDTANTFSGLLVPGFPAVGDYEVFGAPGFPGVVNAAAAGGDVQNGRIYSRGLTGQLLVEGAGIRVAASGNRQASDWLLSDKIFTGTTTTPDPGTGATRDPYDVPAAKRRAVVDAGLAVVVETDTAYYGCKFVDEVYGPEQPAVYECMPSAPAQAGGATVWKWFRFDVL